MSDEPAPWRDGPPLMCSRLLACQNVWFDYADSDSGWLIERVLVHIRLSVGPPMSVPKLCLFAQFHGTPGDYVLRVRLVRVTATEDGGMLEGVEVSAFGPWEMHLPGDSYVECLGIPLTNVPFSQTGVYEFQLWADGIDDMLMNERVEVRE